VAVANSVKEYPSEYHDSDHAECLYTFSSVALSSKLV